MTRFSDKKETEGRERERGCLRGNMLQDEGMMEIAEQCRKLRYLCISNCSHLTDQTIITLANNCTNLVTLECAGLSQLTDAGFQVSSLSAIGFFFRLFKFFRFEKIPTIPTCHLTI